MTAPACDFADRRATLLADTGPRNGIDYVEVLDTDAPAGTPRQRTLVVRFLKPLATTIAPDQLRIDGGVRFRDIPVAWAHTGAALASGAVPVAVVPTAEQTALLDVLARFGPSEPPPPVGFASSSSSSAPAAELDAERARLLVVRTLGESDFSTYTLRLVAAPGSNDPPPGIDPVFSSVEFSFKAGCPSDFECFAETTCPPDRTAAPRIDYLSKDYESFRRLMLDRLATTLPAWTERTPADLGVALVELLAHVGDLLSYEQDAVATESYLGTARRRTAVRRHARLLGYVSDDGASARALVQVQVKVGSSADGDELPMDTPLLTSTEREDATRPALSSFAPFDAREVQRFVTRSALPLRSALNSIPLYLWGGERCCLAPGATSATLDNTHDRLRVLADAPYPLLVLSETRPPDAIAEPRRHPVLVTRATFKTDPLYDESPGQPQRVVEIEWAADDALPFALEVRRLSPEGATPAEPSVVALGNLVIADHAERVQHEREGQVVEYEPLPRVPEHGPYRPRLARGPVARAADLPDAPAKKLTASGFSIDAKGLSARRLLRPAPAAVRPLVHVSVGLDRWDPRADLLASKAFELHMVVEVEDDGETTVRFGDDVNGKAPPAGAEPVARYFVGGGTAGNVGAGAIAHALVQDERLVNAIAAVHNPLPALGGRDPQPLDAIRSAAPQAFRIQRRAVTEQDYADRAAEHPEVQKAVATRRWTGSWYTVFLTVDRRGGRPVDDAFERELRDFLERFRLAGEDLEIEAPRFVALDVGLSLCVKSEYLRARVKAAVLAALSADELPDGTRGFFHPDNFTFQQSVYLSQIVEAVMAVPGVAWIELGAAAPLRRFQRLGHEPNRELEEGIIRIGALEIARLDADPSQPELGRLAVHVEGGL